jgi:hypothetical protein
MAKLSNGAVLVAGQALSKLMGQKMPINASIRCVKLGKELDTHLAVINGVRLNLIKQYSRDGQKVEPGTPEMEAFVKDYTELLSQEVEVKFEGEKIKLPWTIEIDPMSLIDLDMFVEIPEK